jgi:hypothetical protein
MNSTGDHTLFSYFGQQWVIIIFQNSRGLSGLDLFDGTVNEFILKKDLLLAMKKFDKKVIKS